MLGGGGGVPRRGVHGHDALLGGGGKVHIVQAHAGAADDLELGGGFNDLRRDLGAAAHDQRVIILNDLFQLIRAQAEFAIDPDVRVSGKDVEAFFFQFVADQNTEHTIPFIY